MKAEIKRAERFDWCVRSASEGKVWGRGLPLPVTAQLLVAAVYPGIWPRRQFSANPNRRNAVKASVQ